MRSPSEVRITRASISAGLVDGAGLPKRSLPRRIRRCNQPGPHRQLEPFIDRQVLVLEEKHDAAANALLGQKIVNRRSLSHGLSVAWRSNSAKLFV